MSNLVSEAERDNVQRLISSEFLKSIIHTETHKSYPITTSVTNNNKKHTTHMAHSGSSDKNRLEDRLDLTEETTALITSTEQAATSGTITLQDVLVQLYALEKKCRMGNDTLNLVKLCEHALGIARSMGAGVDDLIELINTLCTRRSQKSRAVSAVVSVAMPWTEEYVDEGEKLKLVVALRNVTDGKIFLEAERARLTLVLAKMKEEAGDVSAAADVLQEVHVETYGALSKKEKIEYLLEQMRVTLAKGDYIRAAIVSNKINRKALSEEGMEEHKVRFFTLMTEYHQYEKDAYNLALDYHSIYTTNHDLTALQAAIIYVSLSPYDMDQQQMMNRLIIDENVTAADSSKLELQPHKWIIQALLKKEMITYPTPYQAELESHQALQQGKEHWHDIFFTRLIQHNIRVAASYYRRIHGSRLAELLGLDMNRLEEEVSTMVSDGSVYAKIDRPKDIIRFSAPKSAEAVLTDWSNDISELLSLVDATTHLINKEVMTSQAIS